MGKWIQDCIFANPAGMDGGSSSAHLAFEFALWVGADPIIFVGQDLSFGHNKATHSKFSAYSDGNLDDHIKFLQSQPSYSVPGVDGKPVLTTKLWLDFKSWFERQILLHPETRFIDATEGGAYIQGTQVMGLQKAISTFCIEPLNMNLHQFTQHIATPMEYDSEEIYLSLLQPIRDIQSQFQRLTVMADKYIRNCQLIERACILHEKYPNTVVPFIINTLHQQNTVAFQNYINQYIAPFTQHVILALHKQINDVGEVNSVQRLHAVTKLYKRMFDYLQKICREMEQHFNLAEQRLMHQSQESST